MSKVCGICYRRNGHAPTCPRAIPAELVRAALGSEAAEPQQPPADVPQVMACPASTESEPYDATNAIERLRQAVQERGGNHA